MSWKKTAAVFMTVLCISGGASAYDLQSIAKAHLPPAFTYQDIPEQQELKFHDFTYPYHMGQLSVMLQKSRKFAYGYIVTAKLPPAGADTLKPFFREYLTVKEWRSLSRMNRAFLDEDSPLRKGAEEVMKNWAKNVVGELGEGVKSPCPISSRIANLQPTKPISIRWARKLPLIPTDSSCPFTAERISSVKMTI